MFIANKDFHKVPKGWGYEFWIANKPEYCGKILHFEDGKRCSWHYHVLKDETFTVLSGTIEMRYGETDNIEDTKVVTLNTGDGFYVPVGLRHQMRAVGGPADMIEISTQHFDEDSIRVIPGD